MRCSLVMLAGLLAMPWMVRAALIPSYRMDSLVLLSDAIVLCDEQEVQLKTIEHADWTERRTFVRCKIVQTFKGDGLPTGKALAIEYDSLYYRSKPFDQGPSIPAGRALVFLKKTQDEAKPWSVVTAKLLSKDGVYEFGQFRGNPGPLYLRLQQPENITLTADHRYGEAELLEDLRIAIQKAASLKEPVPLNPFTMQPID